MTGVQTCALPISGVIFFGHDSVRGLTTASAIWVAAAVGMACGTGMITVAALVVALYFVAVLALTPVIRRLIHRGSEGRLRITYDTLRCWHQ